MGFSYENWANDLKVRIAVVSVHTREQELKTAKAELEQFLSQEDRLQMTLNKLGF